ncbi:MAG: acetylglutamate kinase [Thermoleophilaceae bacterium]|nr:acetylglutamate kinase [Thermoleophilaceae bacterium]
MPRDISTLLEALPYIRQFHGQTIVIKYGGAAMVEDSLRESFARDVVLLKYVGMHPVIVHGGGNEISEHMGKLGLDVEFVDGLRVTDQDTVDVAKMVLIGKVNKDIVQRINRHGQLAVGISGDDGGMFRVSKTMPNGNDVGFVGKVDHVNTGLLDHIRDDYISVIAPVGTDREGQDYNINADEAAGAVAHALGASKTIFLTDVAGWLKDPSDPTSLISQTTTDEVEKALPSIEGGMKPKLQACIDAIRGGGNSASIVDGREPHSILLELFTDEGFGTQIKPER